MVFIYKVRRSYKLFSYNDISLCGDFPFHINIFHEKVLTDLYLHINL